MPRVKISEYRSKIIMNDLFGNNYLGVCVDLNNLSGSMLSQLSPNPLVVKVDQAIKKRNKLGLVYVNRSAAEAENDLQDLIAKGYDFALVEPYIGHKQDAEKFLSLNRTDDGIELQLSSQGGVDIESHAESIETYLFDHLIFKPLSNKPDIENKILEKIYVNFQTNNMTYLELNPYLINEGTIIPLDAAIEVDSTAAPLVNSWNSNDFRNAAKLTEVEKSVNNLSAKSPASFSMKVLNENGALFLLLSGGGASVVVIDELTGLGFYDMVANFGEYSGNPSEEETYLYTRQLLSLVINSTAQNKVLLIAGGVANFTDVAVTFKGIIRALEEQKSILASQGITVIVRRGGPNQQKGLKLIQEFLYKNGIKNSVYGPEASISDVVYESVKAVSCD